MSLDDLQDVPVQSSAGFVHPSLGARLAERLTREAGDQDIMRGDIHHRIIGVFRDVTKRVKTPIRLIHLCSSSVDFDRVNTFSAHAGQRRVKASNAREQVDEGELRARL